MAISVFGTFGVSGLNLKVPEKVPATRAASRLVITIVGWLE